DGRFSDRTISELVRATYDMGSVKTGALIVIERNVGLDEYIRTGILLDSQVSRQLLLNIFEKNTPLHDGAVILRKDRILAATCYLPLTDNMELSKDLGTRHRAAVGISEVSDAMVIVVSEETGQVAIAQDSRIIRNVSQEGLTEILKHIQAEEV
ncbi:MAG: DNA integrity scanning protein DisA nucleotide-binding domain protein, partial [Lachnospiraceae bacterium]|nr:DNA integrity scanning protein DisA nucleotide-binding domain protein [Lachnospiraceae bacterium]